MIQDCYSAFRVPSNSANLIAMITDYCLKRYNWGQNLAPCVNNVDIVCKLSHTAQKLAVNIVTLK